MKQTGTVAEFRKKFIEMAAPLEQIPENMLMAHFVNGLKEEIRAEVRMLGLYTLEQAMDLALKVEEKNRVRNQRGGEVKSPSYTSQRPTSLLQLSAGTRGTSQGYNHTLYSTGSISPVVWSPQ